MAKPDQTPIDGRGGNRRLSSARKFLTVDELSRRAGSFRIKLLVAMMLVVSAITIAVLYFAQRNADLDVQQNLEREFQTEFAAFVGVQSAHRSVIAERCRALAKSVRILAALEESDVDDLYLNAAVELRSMLEPNGDPARLHAKFFRFLDADGAVIPPPRTETAQEVWDSQLAMSTAPEEQEIGYVAGKSGTIHEIIATPILTVDTGEVLGAIVLGFEPIELGGIKSATGIWLNGQLYPAALAPLRSEVTRFIASGGSSKNHFNVDVGGAPHLLFYRALNPDSHFPVAYEVCLYSLAESLAQQEQLRWNIIGSGLLALLGGLVVTHFVSGRLSAPLQRLEEDSAENLAHREWAEAALEMNADELRTMNAQLQKALADLKTTQQQIIQQERLRALGQMASGIAHDFNNALVPILGFCELLLLTPGHSRRSKEGKQLPQTIQTAAKDAASVVSRLRQFYRADKGDTPFVSVHLKRLVEQTITLTRPKWKDQAQAAGATVEVLLELESVAPIAGDDSALREVLTNLIFNAVDAMPRGGTLTLRTRQTCNSAILEVEDTGTGMTDDVRQRCLEPFFSTKGESGTGLGLSMVFGIVQRHSGSLDIRSTPGQGTAFIMTFPLQNAATDHEPASQAQKPQRSLHVLVVDDEAAVRDTLVAVLTTDGHEVESAANGAEGLKRFFSRKFDLVVTDKAMPEMNGDQMAAAIKHVAPKTPVILLTGFGLFHEKDEFPTSTS
jgi:signal transduction histidine kinase